jgi:protein TonB
MAEKDKIQALFTPSGCLSNQGLTRYIEGSLDTEEQKLADLHIGGCELCADAISGYQQHAHPGTALPEIRNLNRQLHQRFLRIHQRARKERSMVSVFSVAATIILLAGIFLLLKQREMITEKSLAQARHDSALTPALQPVQPAARPEGELPEQPIKKPIAGKEKKQKEMASAEAMSTAKTEARMYHEPVEADDMAILSDEVEIQASEEAMAEITTDTVIINSPKSDRIIQRSQSANNAPASRKSTNARVETVLAGEAAMKSSEEQKEEAFIIVGEMPRFMDGDISRFLRYIQENLAYPPEAAEAGIEGSVMVNFIINESGKLTDARIIRSADPLLDSEALRVITSSPSWKAGRQGGKPVRVSYTIPVVFSLQEK